MKKTLVALYVATLVILAIALSGMLFRSWRRLDIMKHKVAKLQEQLDLQKQEELRLSQEIFRLKNDPKAVEKVAREKYRMAREGETIYVYKTEKKKGKEK